MSTDGPHLLVLHQGALGDFVLTLSVIQSLRTHLRARQVTAMAGASSARIAAGRSAVDRHLAPDDVGLHTLFAEDGPLDPRLARELDAAAIVLNCLGDNEHITHQRLVTHIVGRTLGTSSSRPAERDREPGIAKVISLDPRPMPDTLARRRHITQQWTDAIREQGLPIPDPSPARIEVERPLSEAAPPKILIHPGSGGRHKCWPLQNFIALTETLRKRAEVAWMAGPVELERMRAQLEAANVRLHETNAQPGKVSSGRSDGIDLLFEPDLMGALQRLTLFSLYIGNDAGMTHLAAAIGLPTVAVFGPTDPQVWRPLGAQVRVVAPPEPAAEISVIEVTRVLQAVEEMLPPPFTPRP